MSTVEEQQFLMNVQLQLYFGVICTSIWVYDNALTLSSAISFVFNTPWTIPKGLFLLSRLWTTTYSAVLLFSQFSPNISYGGCRVAGKYITWSINFGMCISDLILTIRTWAVWGRGRRIGVFLCTFFGLVWISGFVVMGLWERTTSNIRIPPGYAPNLCHPAVHSHLYVVNYAAVLIFEAVLLALMSIKGYQAHVDVPLDSRLFGAVYMNGILSYIYLFGLSLLNLILDLRLPPAYGNILSMFQQIMHSVLACRMLLDLHEYGKITVHGDEFLDYTSSGPLPRDKLGFHPAGAATVSDSSFDPDSLSATITHDENPC